MAGYHLTSSRTVPVAVDRAFDVVLVEPLPRLFHRRYAAVAPVKEVRDQTGTPWGTVGQSRRIVLSDGGAMTERLTVVERPTVFGYRIDELKGPLRLMVSSVTGEWRFEPAGTGTRITWTWDLTPASGPGRYALPAFARMWRGYARQALEEIEKTLV
jgi:hypothetical protein